MRKEYSKKLACVLASLALVICQWPIQASAQSTLTSSWIKANDPELRLTKELTQAQYQNESSECIPDTKFITVPRDIVLMRAEKSRQVCATPTVFGYHDSPTGEIMLSGSSVSGKIQTHEGGNLAVRPLPNKDSVMYFNSHEPLYGSYRYIIDDFSKKIDVVQQPNGTIVHKLRMTNPGKGIVDSGGKLINFSGSHFSKDGKWMIGNAHLRGMFRINITTGENLIYGGGYNHAIGMSPTFVSAISSNGRYAIDTENRYDIFRIYDFDTCIKNSDPLKPANCQYRDLNSFIKARVSNFQRVLKAEFSSDYTIRLAIQLTDNTYRYYTLTANGEKESSLDYLALGDSYASGEGANSYKPETDIRNTNTCHLSRISYPYLPPLKDGLNGVQSVACSGAKMKDIFNNDYHEGTAQSKEKNNPNHDQEIYNSYLPGYRPQSEFVKRTKPKNITISIGGNDINFSKIILECIQPGTCYKNPQERLDLVHTINQQFNDLVATYQNLKSEAQVDGTVYVIGYPSIVAEGGNCALNVLLDAEEIKFSNQILQHLNLVVESAAKKAGVIYIDTTNALHGSRLCETERQKSAVNGGMLGDDKTFSYVILDQYLIEGYFTNSGSYHPNERGHQLLAEFIRRATNGFSLNNPERQVSTPPSLDIVPSLLPENYKTLTPHAIISEPKMSKNILETTNPSTLTLSGFQPMNEIQLRMGETSLGKFVADNDGQISASFTIPDTLLDSLQVIRATGKNSAGEGIEKQKIVYITNNSAATTPTEIFKGFSAPDVPKAPVSDKEIKVTPTSSLEDKVLSGNVSLDNDIRGLTYTPRPSPNSSIHAYEYSLSTFGQTLNDFVDYPRKIPGHTQQRKKHAPNMIIIATIILVLTGLITRIIWHKRLQYRYLE